MSSDLPANSEIADRLERIADLLERQDANEFRVRSYRDAARNLRAADRSVAELANDAPAQLEDLPGIGSSLAGVIKEFVHTGRISLLDRLQQQTDPAGMLTRLPGVGEELASRIVDQLGVRTLEELEQAAHDGRLGEVKGFGENRVQAVKDSLAGMLSRSGSSSARGGEDQDERPVPSIALLLEIDDTYRRRAAAGDLRKIAPRRFNPEGEAWLPIMRTSKQGWSFTALFSNTARAHDLEKTDDWVVVYFEPEDGGEEDQCTVVTSQRGGLEGRRVVRGREAECRTYYDDAGA